MDGTKEAMAEVFETLRLRGLEISWYRDSQGQIVILIPLQQGLGPSLGCLEERLSPGELALLGPRVVAEQVQELFQSQPEEEPWTRSP